MEWTVAILVGIGLLWLVAKTNASSEKKRALQREFTRRAQIVEESRVIIDKSRNEKTKLSRIDVIIDNLEEMHRLKPEDTSVSEAIAGARDWKTALRLEALNSSTNKLLKKAETAKTASTQQKYIKEAMQLLDAAREEGLASGQVERALAKLNEAYHKASVDEHLEKAKRAEFKGQRKRARDHYLDALYNLAHDNIADSKQKEQIKWLRSKITELEGK